MWELLAEAAVHLIETAGLERVDGVDTALPRMGAAWSISGMIGIRAELDEWLPTLEGEGKLLEAQRLHQRTNFDLEMMAEVGYCHGIENYSRHLTGRQPGEALYFPP